MGAELEGFIHVYEIDGKPLDACPECQKQLTTPGAVTFETSDGERTTGEHKSRLDAFGQLVDVAGLVGSGAHSGTSCSACGHHLDDYEVET